MADGSGQKFLIRDHRGNVYGPADPAMLLEWVQQGRIVPGMAIAPKETREWVEASAHPILAEALRLRAEQLHGGHPPAAAVQDVSASTTYEPAQTAQPAQPHQEASQTAYQSLAPGPLVPVQPAYTTELHYSDLPPKKNVMGIIGFITGLLSSVVGVPVCCPCVSAPALALGLVGVVLSSIALFQISAEPHVYSSRGFAIAGLITGCLGLILGAAGLTLFLFQVSVP